jgi:hypothetical protein
MNQREQALQMKHLDRNLCRRWQNQQNTVEANELTCTQKPVLKPLQNQLKTNKIRQHFMRD